MNKKFLIIIIVAAVAGGVSGSAAAWLYGRQFLATQPGADKANQKIIQVKEDSDVVSVVKKVSPAVVSIIISKDLSKIDQYNDMFNDPFFQQFFGQPDNGSGAGSAAGGQQEIGGGSGFIISADGLIVTNKHVVSDTQADYTVLANDGQKYPAKVLALDPTNDIAILKIDAKNLSTVELGSSADLEVGQGVIAIGNALGEFRNTVSTGVVSGLARSITAGDGLSQSEDLADLIQTDASINPGNSGGPLLNLAGQVIGINVAIASGAQNIGFALPIDQVKSAIDSVEKNGRIVRPWLGLRYVALNKDIAAANKLPKDYGALVVRGNSQTDLAVIPGSPADKAGVVENDIILAVDGQKIDDSHTLVNLIARHAPGDTVKLRVYHKGAEKEISVKLEEMK